MHGFDNSIPLFVTRVRGTHRVVTSNIVFDVLCVPRIAHPDYPSCDCLKIVSEDELISSFCEHPSNWGEHQFTSCSTFAKGPRFLTEPRAWFLFSLLEHFTIDFPSHFILSIIDVFRDSATQDNLIFPSAISRILCHFSVPFPISDHFHVMCAIDATTVKWSEAV